METNEIQEKIWLIGDLIGIWRVNSWAGDKTFRRCADDLENLVNELFPGLLGARKDDS